MINTQIFQTPTGKTYTPADKIERSMENFRGFIEQDIVNEQERSAQKEADFMSIYNNVGEIEGVLQQQYSGMAQQMVDATKEEVANWYKQGGSPTDPEFRMKIGEMTGRLRGSIGNAENNLKQLRPALEAIKNNPYMDESGKTQAALEINSLASNPDYLISRNPTDFMAVGEKYERPELIGKQAWNSLPTTGVIDDVYIDAKGNERRRTITTNRFIDTQNPMLEDGTLNISVPSDYLQSALSGELNPKELALHEKTRREKYGDMPVDMGMGLAIKDNFTSVASGGVKDTVVRTADQIRKEQRREGIENQRLQLSLDREQRMASKENAADKSQKEQYNRWDKLVDAYNSKDSNFLQQYKTNNVKDLKFSTEKDAWKDEIEASANSSKWSKLSKNERMNILEELNIPIPTNLVGLTASDSEEARRAVQEALKLKTDKVVGISYQSKGGTKDGKVNWATEVIPVNDPSDLEGAFYTLERILDTKKPTVQTGSAKPNQSTFTGIPEGGFN